MQRIQCPQCGAHNNKESEYKKTFVCTYCSSIFFIENICKIKHSIILQKDKIIIRSKHYKLLEASQLQHPHGIRTEWQLQDQENGLFVLTEEDENFSLVTNLVVALDKNINWNVLQPNTELDILGSNWLVTEKIELT